MTDYVDAPPAAKLSELSASLGTAPPVAESVTYERLLDARSESHNWLTYESATVAPLAVKDMVIVGSSGGEFGVPGHLDAYDVETGERRWPCYTIPKPGEPGSETWPPEGPAWTRGGGNTWVTGTFDPELNLLYWGTGNPAPDFDGSLPIIGGNEHVAWNRPDGLGETRIGELSRRGKLGREPLRVEGPLGIPSGVVKSTNG